VVFKLLCTHILSTLGRHCHTAIMLYVNMSEAACYDEIVYI